MAWERIGRRWVADHEPFVGWYIQREDDDFRAARGNHWKAYTETGIPATDGKTREACEAEVERIFGDIRRQAARERAGAE